MPVVAVRIDKDSGQYRGIRLASGQDLFSPRLVLDPSFVVPQEVVSSPEEPVQILSQKDVDAKVARGICISRASLMPDISNLLVIYPPRSLHPEQHTAVRVLQLGSTAAVCPPEMFLLYLSALCNDASQGKTLIDSAISAIEASQTSERNVEVENEAAEVEKPFVLWRATYIQEQSVGTSGSISRTPSPDGNLNYKDLMDATEKLFHSIYPGEAFFPETTPEDYAPSEQED